MGGIACALALRWRTLSKDHVAEVGAGAVVGQSQTGKQPGQGRPTYNACDAPQGLAPCGTGRQGFGQVIKPG
jgi:hypothetical protein